MATVITQTSGDGSQTRRCDAKCHEAKHEKCTCICGGMNHGKGLKNAVENMRQLWETLSDMDPTAQVTCNPQQLYLFNHKKEE